MQPVRSVSLFLPFPSFLIFLHSLFLLCEMRVLPLCYCEQLVGDEVLQHEASDRVWVPRHMFKRWMEAEEVGSVVVFRMERQAACMWAFHSGDPNTIYAPTWMCEALGVPLEPIDDDTTFKKYHL